MRISDWSSDVCSSDLETRLRAWRDQGMTELFLPLPGTRRLMVCPLEIPLHRDSGACRMVEPDDPELEAIGDARDVLTMPRVYSLGEVLRRGPGAQRQTPGPRHTGRPNGRIGKG